MQMTGPIPSPFGGRSAQELIDELEELEDGYYRVVDQDEVDRIYYAYTSDPQGAHDLVLAFLRRLTGRV